MCLFRRRNCLNVMKGVLEPEISIRKRSFCLYCKIFVITNVFVGRILNKVGIYNPDHTSRLTIWHRAINSASLGACN